MSYWPWTPELPWQWFAWPPVGPPWSPNQSRFRHAFTTRTVWPPGNVPFRLKAWQPDVTSRTLGRFSSDCLNWSTRRGVRPHMLIDLNSGSVVG